MSTEDSELIAMGVIVRELTALSEEERARVLQTLASRFAPNGAHGPIRNQIVSALQERFHDVSSYEDVAQAAEEVMNILRKRGLKVDG